MLIRKVAVVRMGGRGGGRGTRVSGDTSLTLKRGRAYATATLPGSVYGASRRQDFENGAAPYVRDNSVFVERWAGERTPQVNTEIWEEEVLERGPGILDRLHVHVRKQLSATACCPTEGPPRTGCGAMENLHAPQNQALRPH